MSEGEQQRDFLPVEKIAQYLVELALSAGNHGIINLCSGTPVTVKELAESWLTEHHWNIKLKLGHCPYPEHEPMAFWGNNNKLTQLTGKGKIDAA